MSDGDGGLAGIFDYISFLVTDQTYDQLASLESFLVDCCVHAEVENSRIGDLDDAYRIDSSPEGYGTREQAESAARSHFESRVNSLMSDWRGLPDPEGMTSVARQLQHSVQSLNIGATEGRPGGVPQTGIAYHTGQLDERTRLMGGDTINAFRRQVVREIPRVAGNAGLLAIFLGKCMSGEATLWGASRTNVARMVKSAGFAARATVSEAESGDDIGGFLSIVGTIVGGASAFGGPAALALALTSTGLGLAGSLWPAGDDSSATPAPRDPYGLAGGSPDEVLDNLSSALGDLNQEITGEEDGLSDRLSNALKLSGTHQQDFDLPVVRRLLQETDDDVIAPELKVDKGELNRVATHEMQDIADQYRAAYRPIDPAAAWSVWQRPESVGHSLTDLAQTYEWVAGNLEAYLHSSEADVLACAEHLRIAANVIGHGDERVEDDLRGHTHDLRDNRWVDLQVN